MAVMTIDDKNQAILAACRGEWLSKPEIEQHVSFAYDTVRRRIDNTLAQSDYLESREADGKKGRVYRTTERGENQLDATMAQSAPAPELPLVDQAPTREHQAATELILAAVNARQSEVSSSHHPWFLLAGETLKWKTWTAEFCAHLLGLDPNEIVTLMSTETGRSLFKRKGHAGTTVSENPLLSQPLACLDEFHESRDEVVGDARAYLQGELRLLDEGDAVPIEPVTLVTMNFPNEHPDDSILTKTPFDSAQLRRAVVMDCDHVSIPDAKKATGDDMLDKAHSAEPVPISTDCSRVDISNLAAQVIATCLNETAQEVDQSLLEVLASGMTAFYERDIEAIHRTLEDWLWLAATRSWTVENWASHLDDMINSWADSDDRSQTHSNGTHAPPDQSATSDLEGNTAESGSTAEQKIFDQVLNQQKPPAEIVSDGIATASEVEDALEKLTRISEQKLVTTTSIEAMLEEVWEDAYRDGYEAGEADAKEKYKVEYPCNECGEPIPLTKEDAKEDLYETLEIVSGANFRTPRWTWGHNRCHEDRDILTDGGRKPYAVSPPDDLREQYFSQANHEEHDTDRGLTVPSPVTERWETLDELEARETELEETIQSLENQQQTRENHIEELDEHISELEATETELKTDLNDLESKRDRIEQQVAEQEAKLKERHTEYEDLEADIETFKNELSTIEAAAPFLEECAERGREPQEVHDTLREIEDLDKHVASKQATLEDLQNKIDQLEARQSDLHSNIESLEELTKLDEEILHRQTTRDDLVAAIGDLEERRDELLESIDRLDEIADCEEKSIELIARYEDRQALAEDLGYDSIPALESDLTEREEVCETIEDKKQQISELRETASDLHTDIKNLKVEYNELCNEVEEKEEELEALKNALGALPKLIGGAIGKRLA